MSNKMFQILQKAFVNMHLTDEGKEILNKLSLERFDLPTNQDYDAVYHMIEVIEGR